MSTSTIRTKLILFSILLILVTTICLTLGASYLSTIQTSRQNRERLFTAANSLQREIKRMIDRDQQIFRNLTNNIDMTIRFRAMTLSGFADEELPGTVELFAHSLKASQLGYYDREPEDSPLELRLCYSQKLKGTVMVVDEGDGIERSLFITTKEGTTDQSRLKEDPKIFPPQFPPLEMKHAFQVKNGELLLIADLPFNSFFDYPTYDLKRGNEIGRFLLEKRVSFDLQEMDQDFRVKFNIYDINGTTGEGEMQLPSLDLDKPDFSKPREIQLQDEQDEEYDSVLIFLSYNNQRIGYLSASIAKKVTIQKVTEIIKVLSIIAILVMIGIVIVSWFLITRFTRPVYDIAEGLSENASQLVAAADEISAMSNSLSIKSNELASSMQESSASLMNMNSITRENSKLTLRAKTLMNENILKSDMALKALLQLSHNISQVESDSDQIDQIIKTIDQIAFQTNLLSLNAAVEAARAGESGAGFAVVADEVRNLAKKTAQAAQTTQELLQNTIKRVSDGAQALKTMTKDFEKIIASETIMGEKAASINSANKNQLTEIEHTTALIKEIDRISQQVAADSEESAATSEEMYAKAEQMNNYINDLITMVEGNKRHGLTTDNNPITKSTSNYLKS